MRVEGWGFDLGFRVSGLGSRVQGLGFKGLGFRVWGVSGQSVGCGVLGLQGFRSVVGFQGSRLSGLKCLEFLAEGLGFYKPHTLFPKPFGVQPSCGCKVEQRGSSGIGHKLSQSKHALKGATSSPPSGGQEFVAKTTRGLQTLALRTSWLFWCEAHG